MDPSDYGSNTLKLETSDDDSESIYVTSEITDTSEGDLPQLTALVLAHLTIILNWQITLNLMYGPNSPQERSS